MATKIQDPQTFWNKKAAEVLRVKTIVEAR